MITTQFKAAQKTLTNKFNLSSFKDKNKAQIQKI